MSQTDAQGIESNLELAISTKDKCEYLKFISNSHRDILKGRFSAEWRTLTLTLTYYLLSVALKFQDKYIPPSSLLVISVITAAHISIAVISIGFLRSIHKANSVNRDFAERSEDAIEEILKGNYFTDIAIFHGNRNRDRYVSKNQMWAWWWEVAVIVVFAIVSCFVITCG